ncbi:TetR/AcrR family transcriptional regulator [Sneathiella marina]|uniref:TetR/AcrR family transcriptional regulator n=1 Tax=Sneathiella marina TaxID=2950108 RepID=A0ABY4W1Q1_9PROT|nr:TetR/AcrR family transcriptional regulator [Sneathiella marina]USG60892.1 TetR/AcrR family transcriptional regulator [Sneathiella marina]
MAKTLTQNKIKIAAQKLFAEKGMDGVSVREIVAAAGQKNMASLHYYFRTKEDLARVLLLDAAEVIDAERVRLMDAAEAAGGPKSVQEVLEIFVASAVLPNNDPRSNSNIRLFLQTFQSDAEFVQKTVADSGDIGYFRCLGHLKKMMSHIEEATMKRRIYLLQHYVFNALAARERAKSVAGPETPLWKDDGMMKELLKTAENLLLGPTDLE